MRVAVVFGRFQPFHNQHKKLVDHARSIADHTIVILGSHLEPRSLKNPWTSTERQGMIRSVYPDATDLFFDSIRDFPYDNDAWFALAKQKIDSHIDADDEVVIVGCNKDASTFYLEGFPDYELELVDLESVMDATTVRQDLYEGFGLNLHMVPKPVYDWYQKWNEKNPEIMAALMQKFVDVNKYHTDWGKGPFLCVDSILMSEGEWFAIIEHKEGTLAIPGGFLDKGETTLNGARRECREEIGFDPGDKPYRFFIADHPSRDERCHNVSTVYVWDLGDEMPKLIAGDDAVDVHWMDFYEIQSRREEFRADHFHLIEKAYFNA